MSDSIILDFVRREIERGFVELRNCSTAYVEEVTVDPKLLRDPLHDIGPVVIERLKVFVVRAVNDPKKERLPSKLELALALVRKFGEIMASGKQDYSLLYWRVMPTYHEDTDFETGLARNMIRFRFAVRGIEPGEITEVLV